MGKIKFKWKSAKIDESLPFDEVKRIAKRNQQIMRRVFLSPEGVEVLRILLTDWGYFDPCDTEQKRVLNEYAKVFLHDHLGMNRITVYTEFDTEDKE
jgi:hypothetical protein